MKNTILYLCYLLSFLILSACNQQSTTTVKFDNILLEKKYLLEQFNLSDIANNSVPVFLETSEDILIGEINKVRVENDILYISDGQILYRFSLEGKLISAFNREGPGPEEYISITDFELQGEKIFVLSGANQKLYTYSWEGDLLDVLVLEYAVNRIKYVGNNRFIFYMGNNLLGNNHHRVKIYNMESHSFEEELLPIDRIKANYLHVHSPDHFSSSVNGEMFYFEMFNDTIYQLGAAGAEPVILFHYFNAIPSSFYEKSYGNIMEFFQAIHRNGYSYGTNLFLRTATRNIASFYSEGECIMGITSLNGESESVLFKNIVEDISLDGYSISLTELPLFVQPDNRLALVIEAADLLEYYKEIGNIYSRPSLNPDSNPVILLLDLK